MENREEQLKNNENEEIATNSEIEKDVNNQTEDKRIIHFKKFRGLIKDSDFATYFAFTFGSILLIIAGLSILIPLFIDKKKTGAFASGTIYFIIFGFFILLIAVAIIVVMFIDFYLYRRYKNEMCDFVKFHSDSKVVTKDFYSEANIKMLKKQDVFKKNGGVLIILPVSILFILFPILFYIIMYNRNFGEMTVKIFIGSMIGSVLFLCGILMLSALVRDLIRHFKLKNIEKRQ